MFKPDKRFATMDDVVQKIHKTIITYDNKACYANYNPDKNHGDIELHPIKDGYSIRDGNSKIVEYDDPKLLYESPKLGFCNIDGGQCVFLSRIPSRTFSIGLTERVMSCTTLNDTEIGMPFSFPWSTCLKDTIEDIYPLPLEILKAKHKLESKAWSQAFARNFAFAYSEGKGLRLFHNHTPMAFYNTADGCFVPIDDCNGFIESVLHKNGIKTYALSN